MICWEICPNGWSIQEATSYMDWLFFLLQARHYLSILTNKKNDNHWWLGSAEWITANQAGMIDHFFVENQSPVQKNDTLGILKNTALEDVQTFAAYWQNRMVLPHQRHQVPARLSLWPHHGEMSSAYEQFTQAVRTMRDVSGVWYLSAEEKIPDEELRILEIPVRQMPWRCWNVKRELFELDIKPPDGDCQKTSGCWNWLTKHGEQPPRGTSTSSKAITTA